MPDPNSRHVPCCCLTAKRRPCPIGADRERDGKFYCHVHDPNGTFRLQMNAKASLFLPAPTAAAPVNYGPVQKPSCGAAVRSVANADSACQFLAAARSPAPTYPTKTYPPVVLDTGPHDPDECPFVPAQYLAAARR